MLELIAGPSGFHNTPVSKLIVLIFLSLHVIGMIVGIFKDVGPSSIGYLTPFDTISLRQFWRLFTGIWIFTTVGELIFGLLLLYIFRLFERHWGSLKFTIFCIYATVLTFLLQFSVICLINAIFDTRFTLWNGPYGVIFAGVVQYLFEIPSMSSINVWKFKFTEKLIVYLFCLQMLIAKMPESLIIAACAMLVGILYRIPFLRKMHLLVPKRIVLLFNKYVFPNINPIPFRRRSRRRNRGNLLNSIQNLFANAQANNNNAEQENNDNEQSSQEDEQQSFLNNRNNINNAEQLRALYSLFSAQLGNMNNNNNQDGYQVNEDHVNTLTGLGFSREDSIAQLRATNGDVNEAALRLSS